MGPELFQAAPHRQDERRAALSSFSKRTGKQPTSHTTSQAARPTATTDSCANYPAASPATSRFVQPGSQPASQSAK
eukprot:2916145-Alexandrium_andersonii.AAC.1